MLHICNILQKFQAVKATRKQDLYISDKNYYYLLLITVFFVNQVLWYN